MEDGRLLLAIEDALWVLDPARSGAPWRWLMLPDADPEARFNDGKCDPQGRFWVGTMRYDTANGGGRLYRLDTDGSIEPMLDKVTISNGLAWSADGRTMFYVDTPTRRIDAFDFSPDGALHNRRVAVDLADEEGSPDGMTIDDQDHLWVAMWGGSAILRCRPASATQAGQVVERIAMPVRQPTSCTFGGTQFADLFVTSAADGLAPDMPGPQGALLRLRVDAKGRAARRFAGRP